MQYSWRHCLSNERTIRSYFNILLFTIMYTYIMAFSSNYQIYHSLITLLYFGTFYLNIVVSLSPHQSNRFTLTDSPPLLALSSRQFHSKLKTLSDLLTCMAHVSHLTVTFTLVIYHHFIHLCHVWIASNSYSCLQSCNGRLYTDL